jgi:hypothetical protein
VNSFSSVLHSLLLVSLDFIGEDSSRDLIKTVI